MDEMRVIVADGGGSTAFLSEHGGSASMSCEGDEGSGTEMRMGHIRAEAVADIIVVIATQRGAKVVMDEVAVAVAASA